VEDDENDVFFFKRGLRELGFEGELVHMQTVEDAKKYLEGVQPYADRVEFPMPDLIITDAAVCVRDSGLEFLEWVTARGLCPDVPFVVLSGSVTEETRLRAEAAKVTRLMNKASNYKDLIPRLREVLLEFPKECREWLR
jgi:CheY-like chemotaxis protein